ncbi:NAD-dependent succinate-semialdehyde dehydrogenase [Neobacillus sp. PS3-12]|uniref:NAD-dependent succinate-semialdehyde dehydrogenase n=1 Tax=Neobacillus sp. PS3-12 TaxID=3070677 RepID=UPI0027DF28A5|nr:NAD-dependent succinate-semialdehyde dehydrogenase [Neobacillus sp. PS3-12]WML55675.1 NAD-dependent succinate-semialdehyde dehydrogenase [Neobacillus sp. PS3-12]
MLINGESVESENNELIEVINPATDQVIAVVPKGGKAEAKKAADAAYTAFKDWSNKTAGERGQLLMKWFQLVEQNKEEIARIMTLEQGKPLKEAIGEIDNANSYISWYAEEGKRIYGETIPSSHPNKRILIQKQPVGVVAAITPWNFPASMITRKVAPALAAGCTAVIKPATQTPLTAIKLVELAHEAGIPKGVLNVVTGDSRAIGDAWLQDERVRKLTFTGSTEVGKMLMKGAADTVKKISLELGGHAPFIVMDDANIDKAVADVIGSKFRNAGQTCICTNRIYVHESIEEEFNEKFSQAVKKLTVGNGLDQGIDVGPMIDLNAIDKVREQIDDAILKGGKILQGGNRPNIADGYYFEPTIIANATDEMLCMKEETFGPLAPVATFKTEEEVLDRANNTPYGLAAYVFTESLSRAIRISEKLEYGIVGLNDALPTVAQAPFGGFKESGLGREGGHYGIDEYLEVKYVSIAF